MLYEFFGKIFSMAEKVQVEENKTCAFYERLVALPVITEAMNQTAAVYNTVKNKYPLTQYACNTGEHVVKRVTETAVNVGTPVADYAAKVSKPLVGNPVSSLDHMAAQTLEKCEQKFPIITKNPSEIFNTTVNLIKGKANDCLNTVNNNRVVQFTNNRITEAISLSELAVELVLPADANVEEDTEEVEKETLAIKKDMEALEAKGHVERVVALGKRLQRRGTKKLMALTPVQITYDNMISLQDKMTTLVHRSKEAGKAAQDACLVLPNLAIKLTGEAVYNTKEFIIAITHTYSLKDLPGSVATISGKVVEPVTVATHSLVAGLLHSPEMVAQYVLSSKPVQFLIPNVVIFEEISKGEIGVDEFANDIENDEDENENEEEEELET